MNSPEIKQFIRENSSLFGEYILKPTKINYDVLVEKTIINGNIPHIKILFDLLSIEKVAEIFYAQIRRGKHNYCDRERNFFELYFGRHAPSVTPQYELQKSVIDFLKLMNK